MIAAVREGLAQVGRIAIRNYLEKCATQAIQSGNREARTEMNDELMGLILKFSH